MPATTTECPICFEALDDSGTETGVCVHKFHRACIGAWVQTGKNTCPCCRIEFDANRIICEGAGADTIICNNSIAHPRGWWIFSFNPELVSEYPQVIANDLIYIERLKAKMERHRRMYPNDTALVRDITSEIQRYDEQHRVYRAGMRAMGIAV